jgi:hypothetical protein
VWTEAHVSIIFKKGNRKQPCNYRPISLTCVPCKIMEKFIRDWLLQHLKQNHLLSDRQFGFLSGRSTTLQLLRVMEQWTETLDGGGVIETVYFDFKKAFDKVPHERLLAKLRSYGIDGNLHRWIRSFLTNRRHRVVINGHCSDWHPVTSGIPEGSVLGPVLFIIYINDLPETVISSMFLYADDTKLSREITVPADRVILQSDVNNMSGWTELWLLGFHPDK